VSASERKRRATSARRAKALAMRAAGATFQQIADASAGWQAEGLSPYRTAGAACQDITRALHARTAETAATAGTLVALELERLDTIDRAANIVMNRAETGGDPVLVLRAADRIMRISDRRIALLSLAAGAGRGAGGGGGEDDDDGETDPIDDLAEQRRRRRGSAYG
jgi:hypothetical protein